MLPPGPSAPPALQTWEWLARPTTLLRRSAARHGVPFTLRTAWTDAPMVVVTDPADVRAVFTAPADVVRAGASSSFLEPFVGPSSILILDGPEHLRQRKLMLPPFHGDRMRAHRDLIAGLAAAEVERWPRGVPFATHARMQALTLDVIMRVVFGAELPELRAAIRRTLDMTMSLPRALFFSLTGQRPRLPASDRGRRGATDRGHPRPPPHPTRPPSSTSSSRPAPPRPSCATSSSRCSRRATRRPPARSPGRSSGSPATRRSCTACARTSPATPTRSSRRSCARAPCSRSPRASSSRRSRWPAGSCRRASTSRPASTSPTAAPTLYADPTAFRPDRWLGDGAPDSYAWIPFGGGVRRCVGAAFASMEMSEVLRAVAARVELRPDRAQSERMRRRSVTLTPERRSRVIAEPLRSS